MWAYRSGPLPFAEDGGFLMSHDQVSAKADVLPEIAYPPQGLSPSPTLATRSSLGAHFSMADRGEDGPTSLEEGLFTERAAGPGEPHQ